MINGEAQVDLPIGVSWGKGREGNVLFICSEEDSLFTKAESGAVMTGLCRVTKGGSLPGTGYLH